MMDFFPQNISTWTFDRVLNPPYFVMTTVKLPMIIQKRGISFGRTPFNQSKGVLNKILLNTGFQTDIFYGFFLPGKLVSGSLLYSNTLFDVFWFFEGITQNGSLYKSKFLLKKLTMWTYNLYLPFDGNGQEKQIWRGILVRKSHCLTIRGEFRTPSNINDGAKSHYLSL